MNISLTTQSMLNAVYKVVGIIDHQQTMPILANVLIHIKKNKLSITSSDTEMEMTAIEILETEISEDSSFTVSGRKLLDICKALDEDSMLNITLKDQKITLKSGRSRFCLSSLPHQEFPTFESFEPLLSFEIAENNFLTLLRKTSFAMACTDVRYYLNGLLLETKQNQLIAVATDGHRLAVNKIELDQPFKHNVQSLLPRKAALEILKILNKNNDGNLKIDIGTHAIRIEKQGLKILSKLIDGRFPDYEQAFPKFSKAPVVFDRHTLKNAMMRMAILSNEKIRGVHLDIDQRQLKISSANPDLGESEEIIGLENNQIKGKINIGLNVNYFLDVLNLLDTESAHVFFKDSDSSILIEAPNDKLQGAYLIMPMCL